MQYNDLDQLIATLAKRVGNPKYNTDLAKVLLFLANEVKALKEK